MQHIAGSARGRLAQTQQDLLRIAMNKSPMQEEMMEHPICDIGFAQYGEDGLERMNDTMFSSTVETLMKSRPSAHLWDVVPSIPYTEDKFLIESPEAYRMTFRQKAQLLADEFMRRPKMVGFKFELHNVERRTDRGQSTIPSASFTIYEASDDLDNSIVSITIRTRYRTNF